MDFEFECPSGSERNIKRRKGECHEVLNEEFQKVNGGETPVTEDATVRLDREVGPHAEKSVSLCSEMKHPHAANFLDMLPDEVLLEVLSCLNSSDLLQVSR